MIEEGGADALLSCGWTYPCVVDWVIGGVRSDQWFPRTIAGLKISCAVWVMQGEFASADDLHFKIRQKESDRSINTWDTDAAIFQNTTLC